MRPFKWIPWAALAAVSAFTSAVPARSAPIIDLGTAANFGVLAGSTVTNTGPSSIVGSVGVAPGTSITGLSGGSVSSGSVDLDNPAAIAAKTALGIAITAGQALPSNTNLTGQDLGGLTLAPGVYTFDSSAQLTGTLNLNDGGNPNADYVFQIGSTLVTATDAAVLLNGENSDDVFWVVGSSATLGVDTAFEGTILAADSITLDTGASIAGGRALADTGAVTLDTNAISYLSSLGAPELDASTAVAPLALFAFYGLLIADRRRRPFAQP